ncbi:MAG: Aldose 1-epimerase [uncultured Sphingomonadaceae bacterium]|uniref:Aldose 1-epimerase n=1 Tax=uncultured Sphingomonadaceae bacterium TaxID=169976 RepID=A0A6J4RYM4_9SPHN|nr:MAG: Aldose 1-epimerase [uncultured Sphingomonadaceae bacterium]
MRKLLAAGMAMAAIGGMDAAAEAAVSRAPFGQLPDGSRVEAITLSNDRGLQARIITYGAAIQSVMVKDRAGKTADVTLGYPTLAGYLAKSEYFGVTAGRFANRIARGRFTLDGKTYQTPVNNGPNSLHGGTRGFDKLNWTVVSVKDGARPGVTLQLVSPDGDQGYPGTLTVRAVYSLEPDAIRIDYSATTDKPTIVNLTNHAYWNLAGEGSADGAMGHRLTIPADHFTPTDAGAIPTGAIQPVAGTVFDFRRPTPVGERVRTGADQQILWGKGYDHNWVISRDVAPAPRLVARVEEPRSGRVMEVLSDQPGIQFYSGNFLDATVVGKAGKLYRQGDAIVLEPQKFPDTPNRPEFGSARLDPGQTYRNTILFRFPAPTAR